jgi:hypothetical protein
MASAGFFFHPGFWNEENRQAPSEKPRLKQAPGPFAPGAADGTGGETQPRRAGAP